MIQDGERDAADAILGDGEASALDVIDHLLDKGCVVTGRLVLGLARIDLVYVELSLLLCGAERVLDRARDRGEVAAALDPGDRR